MPSGYLGRTRKWKGVCRRKPWGAGMGPSVLWALVQVCWGGEVCGSGLEAPDGQPCHLGPSLRKLNLRVEALGGDGHSLG